MELNDRSGSFLKKDYDLMRLLYLFVRESDYRTNVVSLASVGFAKRLIKPIWFLYLSIGMFAGKRTGIDC